MFKYTLLNISPRLCLFCEIKRLLYNTSQAIVIASAVRTPWAQFRGQLASVPAYRLGQIAVEAAVKQSSVPLEDIKHIIMTENPKTQRENDFIFSDFLKKSKYCDIKSADEVLATPLAKAVDILKSESETVVVMGGMESGTQQESLIGEQQGNVLEKSIHFAEVSSDDIANYIANSKIKFSKAQTEAIFEAELVALNVLQQNGKKKIMREVKQDEISLEKYKDKTLAYSDGASALVLTTWSKADALKLSPLAEIIDYECLTKSETIPKTARKCVENLFAKSQISIENIHHWEIDEFIPQLVIYLKNYFRINAEIVNPHGGSLVLGQSPAVSLPRLLTHLAHALKPEQYGCIICSTHQQTCSLLIKKLPSLSYADHLPLITLYTKDPCPLCDILVEELECNFAGEYELKKVFIDTKENIRYLRLYRSDIPVVFLNNQFVCMHRLNDKLLRQQLDLLKIQNK